MYQIKANQQAYTDGAETGQGAFRQGAAADADHQAGLEQQVGQNGEGDRGHGDFGCQGVGIEQTER